MPNPLEQYLEPEDSGVPTGPNGVKRVLIPTNDLEKRIDPAYNDPMTGFSPQDQGEGEPTTLAGKLEAFSNLMQRLTGTKFGEQRYQTWPEKMIRSGFTLPGDIATGQEAMAPLGLRREDVTDIPAFLPPTKDSPWIAQKLGIGPVAAQPGDHVVERAMDTGGLMAGGAFGATKPGTATLGSGPVLRVARKLPDGAVQEGKPGQIHSDLLSDVELIAGVDKSPGEMGFITPNGKFLNRNDALEFVNKYEPERAPDPARGRLEAHRYNNALLSDSGTPGAPVSALAKQASAPPFYSALENAVTHAKQPKMSYDQWMGYLKNQPGVKAEELAWMGLDEKPKAWGDKPVTREMMEEHLRDQKFEVQEIIKKEHQGDSIESQAFNTLERDHPDVEPGTLAYENLYHEIVDNLAEAPEVVNSTKFEQYQLPGGENYREMLFTLPEKTQPAKNYTIEERDGKFWVDKQDGRSLRGYNTREAAEQATRKLQEVYRKPAPESNYKSSHWDEPNVLAHTRLNDRTIDGKKSLHIEEIQSDWHQEGRKKGYATSENDKLAKIAQQKMDEAGYPISNEDAKGALHDGFISQNEYDAFVSGSRGVPDAPFKQSWPDLVLKRMIREAAEKGYDQISWTPGEAQAARYDLSKQLKDLSYFQNKDGSYDLTGNRVGGGMHVFGDKVPADKLADFVGKDVADKIIKNEGKEFGKFRTLEGVDLKVGGEGMKSFYDKMLVDKANALGKKFGAKVEKKRLGIGEKGNPLRQNEDGSITGGVEAWVLPISDALRNTATQKGFPLFMSGLPFPLEHTEENPWKKRSAQ